MVIQNNYMNHINRINKPQGSNQPAPIKQGTVNGGHGFEKILQGEVSRGQELKFSKHAELRLQSRNINLTQAQKEKMAQAVNRAEAKGVKDSLVIMDNLAFVVSVKNRTVVTAANSSELKENVFTNIDGAVFA